MSSSLELSLRDACVSGDVAWATRLIEAGVSVEARVAGLSMLMWAALNGQLTAVRLLVEMGGADIHVRDANFNRDALALAAFYNKPEVCFYLISKGANACTVDTEHSTALTEYGIRADDYPCSSVSTAKALFRKVWEGGPHESRRNARWTRRWPFISILFGCKFRLMKKEEERLRLATTGLGHLEPEDRSSPEANWVYLLGHVLGNDGLVRCIAGFL